MRAPTGITNPVLLLPHITPINWSPYCGIAFNFAALAFTPSTKSSTVFWSFLETIEFAFGKISRDCYFFRQMKEYADEHPITKTSLIWQIHFENADENSVKNAILQLVKEREKNSEKRNERKSDQYCAAVDNYNNYIRQLRFRMCKRGASQEQIDMLDAFHRESADEIKEKVEQYKDKHEQIPESVYDRISELKVTARKIESFSKKTALNKAV